MTPGAWIAFWGVVSVAGLALFALMAVWVIVAGYADVRALFAALDRSARRRRRRAGGRG